MLGPTAFLERATSMNKNFRQALTVFLLTAAMPLIPVFATFTVPHPSAPACTAAGCRAFALGANSLRIPVAAQALTREGAR
jgi:hypothetical protein